MLDRYEQLRDLLNNNQIGQAQKLIQSAKDHNEGEANCAVVLRHDKASPELIDIALSTFVGIRQNQFTLHGYWVHSLSHFSYQLWEKKLYHWIRRLNEISFLGALELGNASCCDRLVSDFVRYANWDQVPKDFGITPESIAWYVSNEYSDKIFNCLALFPFKSEEAFKDWVAQFRNKQWQKIY